jgi:O-antigen/teichoic acid export membrane protein
MKSAIHRFRSGTLGRNTLWVLGGNTVRLVIQAAYFIIIARSLEPKQYGAFVAVVALAAILAPFVGLGAGNLIVRNVARDVDSFSESWGKALIVTLFTAVCALGIVLCSRVLLPPYISWVTLFMISAADLIFARLSDLCGFAFGAVEQFRAAAQINAWMSLTKLIGVGILATYISHPTVEQWAAVYLATSIISAATALSWSFVALRKPTFVLTGLRHDLGEGFFFSMGQSAQSVYNDIDKTMLANLGDLTATGIYGAAYRLIEVSMTPVRSILSAANPGFFRAGGNGMRGCLAYMRVLLPKALVYSFGTFLILMIAAPVVPYVLGKEYANTVEVLRWLSLLPALKTFHSFLADALTGAGHQPIRTTIQAAVAVFNVLLNLWLIPVYTWRGAAWSSVACDSLLGALLLLVILSHARRQTNSSTLVEEAA